MKRLRSLGPSLNHRRIRFRPSFVEKSIMYCSAFLLLLTIGHFSFSFGSYNFVFVLKEDQAKQCYVKIIGDVSDEARREAEQTVFQYYGPETVAWDAAQQRIGSIFFNQKKLKISSLVNNVHVQPASTSAEMYE